MAGPDFKDLYRHRPQQNLPFEIQFRYLGIDPMGRSPLEQSMGRAILELILDPKEFGPPHFINLFLPVHENIPREDFPPIRPIKEGIINVGAGIWWGDYQADFLFCVKAPKARREAWGALECDGHTFHEKDPEQVSHDRKRDRDFQDGGIFILRFPGWEIRDNPKRCAREAIEMLLRQSAARRAA